MSGDRASWLLLATVLGSGVVLIVAGCLTPLGDWAVNLP